MKDQIFMWRMRAKEIVRHFQESSEQDYGHGVTGTDLNVAFDAADRLYEALITIEHKLEDNQP